MERDWQLEATAALSGSGVSKKLCSSYHSAIFYVGGEPHAFVALHVLDHFFERAGSAEPAGHVRMQLKGREHRRRRRFGVKVVEKALP